MLERYGRTLFLRMTVFGAIGVALVVAVLAWLVYQPGGGRLSAYDAFLSAATRDPSHGAVYARSYEALMVVTDTDPPHYVVHKAAAALASITGHPDAAKEQEFRAEQHLPRWFRPTHKETP